MISRIYIDNCRCFTDFEYRPGNLQLLLGSNGTGKTTVLVVLDMLRSLVVDGAAIHSAFPNQVLTAWDSRSEQTFELDIKGNGGEYSYQLVVGHDRDSQSVQIVREVLNFDGQPLCRFEEGEVQLFHDDRTPGPADILLSSHSAIPTFSNRQSTDKLTWFRSRLDRIFVFYPDPLRMGSQSDGSLAHPDSWLHKLASWIRHLDQETPDIIRGLSETLRDEVFGHFRGFRFADIDQGRSMLWLQFNPPPSDSCRGAEPYSLSLGQLSTGQRALVGLYMMLHVAVGPDMSLCIDEPDIYVALRGIQPWLVQLADRVEDTGGQCLLVSHHPELINYLASDRVVHFFREDGGPVKVRPFEWSHEDALSPAELVARGWEGP